MKPLYTRPKRIIFTSLCILIGNALLGFLVAAFIIPHDIIMGGTTGIGIVLNRVFPEMDISLFVLILNLILLFIGLLVLGKKLFFTTAASSVLYPLFLALFQRIPGIEHLTDNSVLAGIFGGVLMGAALGLVMRVGSSTGGMDIVELMVAKWTHLSISLLVYIGDIIILGFQAFFSTPEAILLGILVLALESLVLDKTMILGKDKVQLTIFSESYEAIREALLNDVTVGATMLVIETGRLRKPGKAVLSVIPNRKLYQATEMIRDIDPEAFITIAKINEVRGRGFTLERTMIDEPDASVFESSEPVEEASLPAEQTKAEPLPAAAVKPSEGDPVVPADRER